MKVCIKEILSAPCGFTLLEVAIALGILSLGIGLVGRGVFQVLHAQQHWQEDTVATKDLRHAGSWFGGDVLNTDTTTLVDGAAAVDTMTLTTFADNEITYGVTGSKLIRTFNDGVTIAQNTLASEVVSVEFSLSGEVVKLALEVEADRGSTKTVSLESTLR